MSAWPAWTGQVVGIVANQPRVRSGAIFVDSADKAARFITMCDAFNIPLVFLHDVPGFMVGVAVERQGIIRHGAKMITAMASAEVPKFSVVLRKAYARRLLRHGRARLRPRRHHRAARGQHGRAMGADAAVNAMYAGEDRRHRRRAERAAFIDARMAE